MLGMEMGRLVWLTVLIPAIMVSSFYGKAAATDGETATAGGPPPETNVLCVSKCGTCPTVCSSPSPPPPSSPNSDGTGSGYSSPSPPRSTTPPSPPAGQQSQAKGGSPSGYYYFLTAGSGRSCATLSVRYTLLLLLLLAVLPFILAV